MNARTYTCSPAPARATRLDGVCDACGHAGPVELDTLLPGFVCADAHACFARLQAAARAALRQEVAARFPDRLQEVPW